MRWGLVSIGGACLAIVFGMAIVTPHVHRDEVPGAAPARAALDGGPDRSVPRKTRVIVEIPAPPPDTPREAPDPVPESPRDEADTDGESSRGEN